MANSKTEIMKVFSQLSPDNQRALLLCARTAKVAEESAVSWLEHYNSSSGEAVTYLS